QGERGDQDLERARHAREVEEKDRGLEEHEEHDGARGMDHRPRGEEERRYGNDGGRPRTLEEPRERMHDQARSPTTSPTTPSRTAAPRRPFGRKIRMRMRMEKAKMSLYSAPKAPPVRRERYEAAKDSSNPRTRPPSMAPGMLPMPPRTAAVKALSPGMKPV